MYPLNVTPGEIAVRARGVFAKWPQVRVAILFGSLARGAGRPDSDVDIAIDAPEIDFLALGAELGSVLDRLVDVVPLAQASIPLYEHLVRDGVVIHEGAPGAGALWRSRTLAMLETDRPWFDRMSKAWLARVASKGLTRG